MTMRLLSLTGIFLAAYIVPTRQEYSALRHLPCEFSCAVLSEKCPDFAFLDCVHLCSTNTIQWKLDVEEKCAWMGKSWRSKRQVIGVVFTYPPDTFASTGALIDRVPSGYFDSDEADSRAGETTSTTPSTTTPSTTTTTTTTTTSTTTTTTTTTVLLTPDERFQQCCRKNEQISPNCYEACSYTGFSKEWFLNNIDTQHCPTEHVGRLHFCATRWHDHRQCCHEQEVPPLCDPFCAPHEIQMEPKLRFLPCLNRYLEKIKHCIISYDQQHPVTVDQTEPAPF